MLKKNKKCQKQLSSMTVVKLDEPKDMTLQPEDVLEILDTKRDSFK